MIQGQAKSFIATASGVFGGVGKALSTHLVLASITFQGTVDIVYYAAISALVGYGIKEGIDFVRERTKKGKP